MEKLTHEIEYLVALAGGGLARSLSAEAADRLAVRLGTLVHAIWGRRRSVAYTNMSRALGNEMPDALIRSTVKLVFQNMARSLVETSRFAELGREGALRIIEAHGTEDIEEARRRGKGCVLITAHFGNWELLGNWPALLGHPASSLVGVQHNAKIHELFNSYRRSFGAEIIEATVAARGVVRALRHNRVVTIAADQHSHTGLPVQFFGRTAIASRGPALLAVKAGAPLLPMVFRRDRFDRFVVIADPPLYPPESGDINRDVDELTVATQRFYERVIRQYPDQWMWTHRRWKAAEALEKSGNYLPENTVEEP